MTTSADRYGVMVVVLEFILSIVVLLGGGFLLYSGHSPEVAVSAITAVITFWFARRSAEATTKQLQQLQQQPAQDPQPAAKTKPNPFAEDVTK